MAFKVSLNGEQFQRLCQGDVVRVDAYAAPAMMGKVADNLARPDQIEIVLEDIGFEVLKERLEAARREKNFGV